VLTSTLKIDPSLNSTEQMAFILSSDVRLSLMALGLGTLP